MICISFDSDHLDDQRMREFLGEVQIPGSATFFCTQRYPSLEEAGHEICPHPTLDAADPGPALDAARREFPDAIGFRSHSCLHSHMLAIDLAQRGFLYVSAQSGVGSEGALPYREGWGIWHLPIYYVDNVDFSYERHWPGLGHEPFRRELIDAALEGEGVYVFDFHPIHVLLNSPSPEEYLARRDAFLGGAPLEEIRCEGYGARSFYDDLVAALEGEGLASVRMADAVEQLSGTSPA